MSAENEAHVPLGNSHFNVWAAGIVSTCFDFSDVSDILTDSHMQELGDEISTIRKPPNHSLFNGTPEERLGNMSSLLKKRLEDKKGSAMPNIMVNIPPLAFPQPANSASAPTQHLASEPELLIPKGFIPGIKMSINEFCTQFELDGLVCNQLLDEGYRSTASFAYVKIADLTDAGLKRGHISEMKVAISRWAFREV